MGFHSLPVFCRLFFLKFIKDNVFIIEKPYRFPYFFIPIASFFPHLNGSEIGMHLKIDLYLLTFYSFFPEGLFFKSVGLNDYVLELRKYSKRTVVSWNPQEKIDQGDPWWQRASATA